MLGRLERIARSYTEMSWLQLAKILPWEHTNRPPV